MDMKVYDSLSKSFENNLNIKYVNINKHMSATLFDNYILSKFIVLIQDILKRIRIRSTKNTSTLLELKFNRK